MKKISLLLLSLVVIGSPLHAGNKGKKKFRQREAARSRDVSDGTSSSKTVVPYSQIAYGIEVLTAQDVYDQHKWFDALRSENPSALNALVSVSLRNDDGKTPSDECSYCGIWGYETPGILAGYEGVDPTSLTLAQLYFLNKYVHRDEATRVLSVVNPLTHASATARLDVLEEYNCPWVITTMITGRKGCGWRDKLVTPDQKERIEGGYTRLLNADHSGLELSDAANAALTMQTANREFSQALVAERDSQEKLYRKRGSDGRWEKRVHNISTHSLEVLTQLDLLLPDGSMHDAVALALLPNAQIDVH